MMSTYSSGDFREAILHILTMEKLTTFGARLEWALKRKDMSSSALSRALGISRNAVSQWKNLKNRPAQETLTQTAQVLGVDIHWLATGQGEAIKQPEVPKAAPGNHAETRSSDFIPVHYAPVRGRAAAGVWLEFEAIADDSVEMIPYVPSRYPNLEQFAYVISGNSMDKERIFDGDYVTCVEYSIVRAMPQPGDVVIAERRDRGLFERACKKLEMIDGRLALVSKSTDPRFKGEIPLGNGEVEVIGLVIGTFRPRF